jgi:hypothetical protein
MITLCLMAVWYKAYPQWAEIQAAHPQARMFVPAPLTPGKWEAIVPGEQATVYADPYAVRNA